MGYSPEGCNRVRHDLVTKQQNNWSDISTPPGGAMLHLTFSSLVSFWVIPCATFLGTMSDFLPLKPCFPTKNRDKKQGFSTTDA